MCCVPHGQLLIFIIISGVQGMSVYRSVNLMNSCSLTCAVPQPRSFRLAQELQIAESTAPYMTVLHRCDEGTGCCQGNNVCKMANFEILNATVMVKVNKAYEPRFFEVKNHTKCSCQSINGNPK